MMDTDKVELVEIKIYDLSIDMRKSLNEIIELKEKEKLFDPNNFGYSFGTEDDTISMSIEISTKMIDNIMYDSPIIRISIENIKEALENVTFMYNNDIKVSASELITMAKIAGNIEKYNLEYKNYKMKLIEFLRPEHFVRTNKYIAIELYPVLGELESIEFDNDYILYYDMNNKYNCNNVNLNNLDFYEIGVNHKSIKFIPDSFMEECKNTAVAKLGVNKQLYEFDNVGNSIKTVLSDITINSRINLINLVNELLHNNFIKYNNVIGYDCFYMIFSNYILYIKFNSLSIYNISMSYIIEHIAPTTEFSDWIKFI